IYYNEIAFCNILGDFLIYFRLPYINYNTEYFTRLIAISYPIIYYNLDTFDYLNNDSTLI
ncbi:hypothetical protein F5882DRAFT_311311, partial [Hyaloscypha sp. PMI_1271]